MLGRAAAAMWYEVLPEVREEWEDWHTHEHMPERLGIPGFLRGSRWVSGNAFFGLYETKNQGVLTGGAYMERLNNPTPWSQKMMPHHRQMMRSLCRVRATAGTGLPGFLATLRFAPSRREKAAIVKSLAALIPQLPSRKGLSGAHLLQSQPMERLPQTAEQKIRGGDAQADWVLLVGGYDADVLQRTLETDLAALPGAVAGIYRLAFSLSRR